MEKRGNAWEWTCSDFSSPYDGHEFIPNRYEKFLLNNRFNKTQSNPY